MIADWIAQFTIIVSAYTDAAWFRIPNCVTFPGIIAGMILCGVRHPAGLPARAVWLLGIFAAGSLHLMGMGDLKLWMALAALIGPEKGTLVILSGMTVMAVYLLILRPSDFAYHFLSTIIPPAAPFLKKALHYQDKGDVIYYPLAFFILIGNSFLVIAGAI